MATPTLNYTAATTLTSAKFSFLAAQGAYVARFPPQPIYVAVGTTPSHMALIRPEMMLPLRTLGSSPGALTEPMPAGVSVSTILWRSRWRPKRGQLWPRTR